MEKSLFPIDPVWVWGVPFVPWTMDDTLAAIDQLVEQKDPGFFITANLNYCMLCDSDSRLRGINRQARFILCDGKPILWRSRWKGRQLPERVAGSDLLPRLCAHAAEKGHRLYFLGGAPGTAEKAVQAMQAKHPTLQIAGWQCPPHRPLTAEEHDTLVHSIRASRADILFLGYGQPKGEYWLEENIQKIGVPICVQVGGTFDFLSGRIKRAPGWMQKTGLEWVYRWCQEPRRLAKRYTGNMFYLAKMLLLGSRHDPKNQS